MLITTDAIPDTPTAVGVPGRRLEIRLLFAKNGHWDGHAAFPTVILGLVLRTHWAAVAMGQERPNCFLGVLHRTTS